jgi:TolB-like protein
MSLFNELKRRNVFRVAIAYLVSSWLLIQLADVLVPMLDLPDWVSRFILLLLVILFVPTLIAAWALELTPDGLKFEKDVDRSASITPTTGKRLNNIIIGILCIAVTLLLIDKVFLSSDVGDDVASVDTTVDVDRSIAVLPFTDLSQGQDQEWFADGLAEEILNALMRTPDLLVSARTSTFAYKGSDKDIPTIAKELGVAHVLEGSVRRSGDRLRVTAQLIRARDGFHLWSQNYDSTAADVIDIQEDLAMQIANALETTMDPGALADMLQAGTRSVDAYQAYLHGASLWTRSFLENRADQARQSLDYFEQARQLDPRFSAAHLAAAKVWSYDLAPTSFQIWRSDLDAAGSLQKFAERMDDAARTASNEIDKTQIAALRALVELRLRESIRLYQRFVAARPNNLEARRDYLAAAVAASDREAIHDSLAFLKNAGQSDPFAASVYMDYAFFHDDASEAADFGLAAIEKWPTANMYYQTHRTLLYAGRIDEAADIARSYARIFGHDSLVRARQACAEGRRDEVLAILEEIKSEAASTAAARAYNPIWLAYKMLGEEQLAEDYLRQLDGEADVYVIANWLSYYSFDPKPFSALMRVLQREGVQRPPPVKVPFACPAR